MNPKEPMPVFFAWVVPVNDAGKWANYLGMSYIVC